MNEYIDIIYQQIIATVTEISSLNTLFIIIAALLLEKPFDLAYKYLNDTVEIYREKWFDNKISHRSILNLLYFAIFFMIYNFYPTSLSPISHFIFSAVLPYFIGLTFSLLLAFLTGLHLFIFDIFSIFCFLLQKFISPLERTKTHKKDNQEN